MRSPAVWATQHRNGVAAFARPSAVRILLVGAEPGLRGSLERWAAAAGARSAAVRDLPNAVRLLAQERWDAVLAVLDGEPEARMVGWIEALRGVEGCPHILVATSRPSVDLALGANRCGVLDLMSLPPGREDFVRALDRVQAARSDRVVALPPIDEGAKGAHALVGDSPAMLQVYKQVAAVAASDATVLVQGESGTGKELVARAIHANGPRRSGPFVAVNCAAVPENLLESEFFGHERGSFTGALERRIGRFEQAKGGTILLDEVADMGLALQAKILRALQEREIERVGGIESVKIDVRVVAATNHDLAAAIENGRFRRDLFYRLAVVRIELPPLRKRGDDLLLLTTHYAQHFARRYDKRITGITERALSILRRHPWPGNVRELGNVIERAVILSADETLRVESFPEELRDGETNEGDSGTRLATLAEVDARHIASVLAHTGGRIGPAAQILGIHRNTLRRKIKEHAL